jgi:hypothetical protein
MSIARRSGNATWSADMRLPMLEYARRIEHLHAPTTPLRELLGLNTLLVEPSPGSGKTDQRPVLAASAEDLADQVPAEPRRSGYRSCPTGPLVIVEGIGTRREGSPRSAIDESSAQSPVSRLTNRLTVTCNCLGTALGKPVGV